eukprot:CCRYP_019538-RA/>CCRYP_019538-RA protein AED:0.24 eAED:0.24 QI:0/-1/0/1/-1/1/1/0/251
MSPNLIGDNNSRTTLLHHVRSLVQAEQGLTDALETCRPLLSHNRHHPNTSLFTSQTPPTLLPTPTSPHQIQPILALARTYSLRTSAPPTWNPSLPVVGFATPNPLPHQLRGGSLGGMQLKLAKEEKARKRTEERERRERERARKEEEERARVESLQEEDMLEEEEEEDVPWGGGGGKRKRGEDGTVAREEMGVTDPKKKEMMERQQRQLVGVSARNGQGKRMVGGGSKEVVVASMNLSDDSSSSEEESEDD